MSTHEATAEVAVPATAAQENPDIDTVIADLKHFALGGMYVPTALSTEITELLFGHEAGMARWSWVAKALCDQGQAIAVFLTLFPEERWLLAKGRASDSEPEFGFAVYAPYPDGGAECGDELVVVEHDICAIAIILGALEYRKLRPLDPTTGFRGVRQ